MGKKESCQKEEGSQGRTQFKDRERWRKEAGLNYFRGGGVPLPCPHEPFMKKSLLEWYYRDYLKVPMEMTVREINALNKKHSRTMTDIGNLCVQAHGFKKVKISRNDPCPCGSNLKYKKCCGR